MGVEFFGWTKKDMKKRGNYVYGICTRCTAHRIGEDGFRVAGFGTSIGQRFGNLLALFDFIIFKI